MHGPLQLEKENSMRSLPLCPISLLSLPSCVKRRAGHANSSSAPHLPQSPSPITNPPQALLIHPASKLRTHCTHTSLRRSTRGGRKQELSCLYQSAQESPESGQVSVVEALRSRYPEHCPWRQSEAAFTARRSQAAPRAFPSLVPLSVSSTTAEGTRGGGKESEAEVSEWEHTVTACS
ncbi:hypothetical protein NDU88_003780 [Pleurodeles waltl]|uniref:Uncharacterized protein n=1 Tax=Pleurodeles waltl TaxID=8319 RepID=A0AAV7WW95_PLEWA|nr:hypothetical protein NDU88_003780 [Pleurodeles waltl]